MRPTMFAFALLAPLMACDIAGAQTFPPLSCSGTTSCLEQGDCGRSSETIAANVTDTAITLTRASGAQQSFNLSRANISDNSMDVFSFGPTPEGARVSLATFDYTSARLDLVEPEGGDNRITVFECSTVQ